MALLTGAIVEFLDIDSRFDELRHSALEAALRSEGV